MNGRVQESTRVEQVKTSANELEVEEDDKILAKKVGKYKESELDWIDKGNAKEKYKGKENGSKIMTWWQKVLC